MNETNDNPLHIVGTDLLDYSFKVEQAIKQGYTFSNLNMYAPRAWPHMFEAWMLQGEDYYTLQIPEEKRKEMLDMLVNAKTSGTFNILDIPERNLQFKEALKSASVASNGTSEGVDTSNETKAATGASKGATKRGRK